MKKIVLSAFLAAILSTGFAQQVPNENFQNWSNAFTPAGWFSAEDLLIGAGAPITSNIFTFKDTSTFTVGTSSLKLVSDSVAGISSLGVVPGLISLGTGSLNPNTGVPAFTGIAFAYRPDSLVFDYEFTTPGTDTAAVEVQLSKLFTDDMLQVGFALPVTQGWQHVAIPLDQFYTDANTPDTVLVQFFSSGGATAIAGSTLHIDGFYFGYTTGANTLTATATAAGAVNFCSPGSVTLDADTGTGTSYTYQWLLNGTAISDARLPQFVASASGTYAVLIDSAGVTGTSAAITVVDSNCTGISNIPSASFSVYPNPATTLLNINSSENLTGAEFQVYDMLGRVVISQVLTGINNTVDVAKLANGTYLYRIADKENNIVTQSKFNVIK